MQNWLKLFFCVVLLASASFIQAKGKTNKQQKIDYHPSISDWVEPEPEHAAKLPGQKLSFDTQLSYVLRRSVAGKTTEKHILFFINQNQSNYALKYSLERMANKEDGNPVWLGIYNTQGIAVTELTGRVDEQDTLEITAFGGSIYEINNPRLLEESKEHKPIQLTKTGGKEQVGQWHSEEYTGQLRPDNDDLEAISFAIYFSQELVAVPYFLSVLDIGDETKLIPLPAGGPTKIAMAKKNQAGKIDKQELILQDIKKIEKTLYYDAP